MKRYRCLVPMSLRKSADKGSPLYDEWLNWQIGDVFDPPSALSIQKALDRGLIEEMGDGPSSGAGNTPESPPERSQSTRRAG